MITGAEGRRQSEGSIIVDEDGSCLSASPAALRLLGVASLDELRALPAEGLAADPVRAAALRQQWRDGGLRRATGEATIVRPDGERARLRFSIVPRGAGTYHIVVGPSDAPLDGPTLVYSMGDLLRAWRAAERRLAAATRGTPDWRRLRAEVKRWQHEYRRLARGDEASPPPHGSPGLD